MYYHDPLREGPRNDRIQELMTKYQRICREEGLAARAQIVAALRNLDTRGVEVGTQAIAWVVATNSHQLANKLLDSPEFRPLLQNWTDRFTGDKIETGRQRLFDLGAVEYQRAVQEGGQ